MRGSYLHLERCEICIGFHLRDGATESRGPSIVSRKAAACLLVASRPALTVPESVRELLVKSARPERGVSVVCFDTSTEASYEPELLGVQLGSGSHY
jgi:hypothetical protein